MATPLDSEAVTIQNLNMFFVKSHLHNFGSKYFKYSNLIKKLAFKETRDYEYYEYDKYGPVIRQVFYEDVKNHGDQDEFSRLEFLDLLDQLPNLNVIDFSKTFYFEEYVEYLLKADLQHINNIDTGCNLDRIPNDLLFSVYYKFRNSITSMRLVYDKNIINFNLHQINMVNSLTHFKKLTELELYTRNDIHLTAFQVQNNCPNLKHLTFNTQNDSGYKIHVPYVFDDISIINLNFISNLTYLDLHIPFLSTTYTSYLVDYFPNQLTEIYIKLFCQKFFSWIAMVGMELALKLMEKVGGVKETYIGFLRYEEYQKHLDCKENMTKYFTLLNSFRGT